jgi:hypothetical protein
MSPKEQEFLRQQMQARIRRVGLYFVGFVLFIMIFSRNPARQYSEYDGTLVPIYINGRAMEKFNDPNYQAYLADQKQAQYPQSSYG